MTTLELTVDEGRVASASRFFRAGTELLNLLDELADTPQDWSIEHLRTGSAVAYVGAPSSHREVTEPLRDAYNGLWLVASNHDAPSQWSPDAVRAAHRFSTAGQAEDDVKAVPPKLRLVDDSARDFPTIDLSPGLSQRLADLQPFERDMPGLVRGTLVGLNVSRGNRASLRLPEGRIVRVRFGNDLREVFKEAMLSEVEVSGQVRQDADGRVFHVQADDVATIPRPAMRWVDLFGSARGITGGLSVEEYLEANRGEG